MKSARYLYVPSVHPPLVLAVVGPWPCGLDPRQHVMPLRFHTPGVAVRAFFVVHCIQRFNILLSMTIGADSTGATGTFAPVLSKVLGREYGFAPVLFEPSKN